MMALLLVAEDASTVYGGAGDPLPPGRGHAHLVVLAITGRRWSRAIGALPLVRVPILVLAELIRTVSQVQQNGGTGRAKKEKKLP